MFGDLQHAALMRASFSGLYSGRFWSGNTTCRVQDSNGFRPACEISSRTNLPSSRTKQFWTTSARPELRNGWSRTRSTTASILRCQWLQPTESLCPRASIEKQDRQIYTTWHAALLYLFYYHKCSWIVDPCNPSSPRTPLAQDDSGLKTHSRAIPV